MAFFWNSVAEPEMTEVWSLASISPRFSPYLCGVESACPMTEGNAVGIIRPTVQRTPHRVSGLPGSISPQKIKDLTPEFLERQKTSQKVSKAIAIHQATKGAFHLEFTGSECP
jgi:hypothetical protein